jgi:hypothetical protein
VSSSVSYEVSGPMVGHQGECGWQLGSTPSVEASGLVDGCGRLALMDRLSVRCVRDLFRLCKLATSGDKELSRPPCVLVSCVSVLPTSLNLVVNVLASCIVHPCA